LFEGLSENYFSLKQNVSGPVRGFAARENGYELHARVSARCCQLRARLPGGYSGGKLVTPISEGISPPMHGMQFVPGRDFGSLGVLVIDDDDLQRRFAVGLLKQIGVGHICDTGNAAGGIATMAFPDLAIDVVMCDLDMPEMDGMEFLRRLAESRNYPAIIITSATGERVMRSVELMAAAHGLRVLGSIPKPLTIERLREVLAKQQGGVSESRGGPAFNVTAIDVAHGLDAKQFQPFFQPKINLSSGLVCGAEALARWRHPILGTLKPAIFLEELERSGRLWELTQTMIDAAAQACSRWRADGLNIGLSVNISLASLQDVDLVKRIVELTEIHGMEPRSMTFEVTETSAMADAALCLEILARLRMKGFGLSIDDYGTGFSSMQQLARIPFSELKIDRAFVSRGSADPRMRAAVESSVDIARSLGLTVVAEGVETIEDWRFMREVGVDTVQGSFISPPMPADEFIRWAGGWNAPS
jgi:EAL domain-containing protein (putative c-di-GMP-specific phosphodiesterase class I)